VVADEQAAGGNHPGGLNLQPENPAHAAADALQPQGAPTAARIFRAKHAANYEIKQGKQHFAAKP
jgi:hypothetical protein